MTALIALALILLLSGGLMLLLAQVEVGPMPGSEPATHAWQRFHLRYYPMTLLFIAFEMEMMFMYPWAVVYAEIGAKALAEMGMFLLILSIGIFYGWREGIFRWQ